MMLHIFVSDKKTRFALAECRCVFCHKLACQMPCFTISTVSIKSKFCIIFVVFELYCCIW